MPIKWIVLVSRANARVFNQNGYRPVTEIKGSLGKEKNKALTRAKPGVGRAKFSGSSPHKMTGEKNPHEDAAIAFAKKVDRYLSKQLNLKKFDKLLVVAEPKMMGRLKKNLDKNVKAVTKWMAKDLGKVPATQVEKALREEK